jgi:hypothetical protein
MELLQYLCLNFPRETNIKNDIPAYKMFEYQILI